jgi:hypothetical protein
MKIRVLQRTPSAYVTPADDALGLAMHWQFFDPHYPPVAHWHHRTRHSEFRRLLHTFFVTRTAQAPRVIGCARRELWFYAQLVVHPSAPMAPAVFRARCLLSVVSASCAHGKHQARARR